MQSLVLDLYGYEIGLLLGTDNSTTKLDIELGFSKGMRHLRKHQRISLGLLAESLERDDAELRKIGTDESTADLFTKALGTVKFLTHRDGLGGVRL